MLQGPTNPLIPPQRTSLPLWLALLLKRQRRANILPPPWLHKGSLQEILEDETIHFKDSFSPAPSLPLSREYGYSGKAFITCPPFVEANTANAVDGAGGALPYHWFEMAELLLDAAPDDLVRPDEIRQLLRDIREVRLAKMRKGIEVLSGDGEGVRLDGVGAMEVSESRRFISGVVDGLRRIGGGKDGGGRERREEEQGNRGYGEGDEDEDEEMT